MRNNSAGIRVTQGRGRKQSKRSRGYSDLSAATSGNGSVDKLRGTTISRLKRLRVIRLEITVWRIIAYPRVIRAVVSTICLICASSNMDQRTCWFRRREKERSNETSLQVF